jgi:hypothetical protein
VARHIDDFFGHQAQNPHDGFGVTATAGWVKYNRIGFEYVGDTSFDWLGIPFHVFEAVGPGVLLATGHSRGVFFDTNHPFGALGQRQGKGTGTTKRINDTPFADIVAEASEHCIAQSVHSSISIRMSY